MKDPLETKKSQILKEIRAFCKETPELWGQSKKSLELASLSILKDLHNHLQKPEKFNDGREEKPNVYIPNKNQITSALNRTLRLIDVRTPRPFVINNTDPKSPKSRSKNKLKTLNPEGYPAQDSPH